MPRGIWYLCFIVACLVLGITLKQPQYFNAMILGIGSFAVIEIVTALKPKYPKTLNKLFGTCYVSCDKPICKAALKARGHGYFLLSDKNLEAKLQTCMLSLWGVLHLVVFFLGGLLCPDLLIPAILFSIVFEAVEYLQYKCHDLFNLVLNIGGFLLGMFIYRRLNKK